MLNFDYIHVNSDVFYNIIDMYKGEYYIVIVKVLDKGYNDVAKSMFFNIKDNTLLGEHVIVKSGEKIEHTYIIYFFT